MKPIELERYSTTNKIWSTKVKRLRLPDLLCLRTGMRVEVRGKSKLELRMSHAPTNRARHWCTGLRSKDLVAFVKCHADAAGSIRCAANAELFFVRDLRASFDQASLGSRKAASEGSELDLCWPSIVPRCDGEVVLVTSDSITMRFLDRKPYTYRLNGKAPYVTVGDRVSAGEQFLAAAPRRKASFASLPSYRWDPRTETKNPLDRFVCAKALGELGTRRDWVLLEAFEKDKDRRVALEASGALAKLGSTDALERLAMTVVVPPIDYLQIEAVFILSEIRGVLAQEAAELLAEIASSSEMPDEVRQAAIWGLGQKGHRQFSRLLPFLAAVNEDDRLHAIASFGTDIPPATCRQIVQLVANPATPDNTRASAAEVLSRLADPRETITHLARELNNSASRPFACSVLGRLHPASVTREIRDRKTLSAILPVQLASEARNWVKAPGAADLLALLLKQAL